MLTFEGHHFGTGSFLSRSLSINDDKFFPVTHLDHPTIQNHDELIKTVEKELQKGSYLSVWIEPIRQKLMDFVPHHFLLELRKLCTKYKTSLVFNETCSSFYRYDENEFFASNIKMITPDCTMTYLGGQAGQVFIRENLFLSNPLMLISTWDGDEFAFSNFYRAARNISENNIKFHFTKEAFDKKLTHEIQMYQYEEIHLKNGIGWFTGVFPHTFAKQFQNINGRYLVNPTFSMMKRYLKEGS